MIRANFLITRANKNGRVDVFLFNKLSMKRILQIKNCGFAALYNKWANLEKLRISQDICYVRMTVYKGTLAIYRSRC